MKHTATFQVLALSLLMASGCQTPPALHAMRQPVFALGQLGSPGEVASTARPTQNVGGLTVSFEGELAQWTRRVLATVADVEKVVVTVTPTGAASVSQTVLKTAIANGQTSVTFQGLPPGVATVTITAFNASDSQIGAATKTTTITAGQTAAVDVALQLAPTIVTTTGGGSTPTTGGLTTNVAIVDGPVVTALPNGGVIEKHAMPFLPIEIASNGDDDVWVLGASGQSSVLVKLSTSGSIEQMITLDGYGGPLCVDANGDAWVVVSTASGQNFLAVYNAAGTRIKQVNLASEHSIYAGVHMRLGLDETVYFLGGPNGGGTMQAPDGSVTYIQTGGSTVREGTLNDLWVGVFFDSVDTEKATSYVVRYSKTGAELGRYSVGAGYRSAYTAIDQQGNAWVTALRSDFSPGTASLKGRLVKFSPQGQQLGVFDLSNGEFANAVEISSDGRVWVVSDSLDAHTVTWFDQMGAELGCASLPEAFYPWHFAATREGAWVVQYNIDSNGKRAIYRVAPGE